MTISRQQLDQAIAAQTEEIAEIRVPNKINLSDTDTAPSGSLTNYPPMYIQDNAKATLQGAGFSLGNAGGWSVGSALARAFYVARRGISQIISPLIQKHAVGDCAALYAYVYSDGGVSAESDEGVAGIQCEQNENQGYFHGTVGSTTGRGDRSPVWVFSSGNNWTTDGAFMLNISKSAISGNVTGPSQPLSATFLNHLPVNTALPLTTAWGSTGAIPNQNTTADSPITVILTVQLQQIGSAFSQFTVGHCVIAGSNYVEQSIISAVTAPDANNQQKITLLIRNPNQQAFIFQGGIAGQYISFGANLRFSGMRSSYYAFGSLMGNDLIYGVNVAGDLTFQTLPQIGSEAATNDGGPNSDFMLIPGAEIVCNPVFGAAQGTLEPNNVNWASGDLVENPHYPVWGGTAAWFTKWHTTPSNSRHGSSGSVVEVGGPGFGGGNTQLGTLHNINPSSYYKGNGGPLVAPLGNRVLGPVLIHHYCEFAPEPYGAVTFVQNPNNPKNPNADVLAISFDWLAGANFWFRNGSWWSDGPIAAASFNIKGTPGANGSFQTPDGKTVTVEGGLIVKIE